MDKTTFVKHYCANYKLLEDRVIESSNYVSIDRNNYAAFSSNYIFLLLSVCSEIDSVAGEYCKIISPDEDVFGIMNKIDKILSKHSNLRNAQIVTKEPYEEQYFVPFAKFENNSSTWWTDYNKIKHNRTEKDDSGRYYYQKANLKNVLHSIASLYILLFLIGKEFGYEGTLPFESRLFKDSITI